MKPFLWKQSGQALLESLFVLPLVTLLLLASLQMADLVAAQLAAGWAAHMAVRSAAVIPLDPSETPKRATEVATRLFAPFLPSLSPEHESGIPLAGRWVLRGSALSLAGTHSIRISLELGFRDGTWLALDQANNRLQQHREPVTLRLRLHCLYKLRIPLVRTLFAGPGTDGEHRLLEAEAWFPLMEEGNANEST